MNSTVQKKQTLSLSLEKNVNKIRAILGNSNDLVIRRLRVGPEGSIRIAAVVINGLVDNQLIFNFILESFAIDAKEMTGAWDEKPPQDRFSFLKSLISLAEMSEVSTIEDVLSKVLSGDTAILIDGEQKCIIADTKGWRDRGITEPSSETVVRGPKEGFTETLRTNTALLRRKIKDPNLWIEQMNIGRVSKTDVSIVYIKGIVNDKIVQEVRDRLNRIDVDGILESGNVEEFIQDKTYTPFPTIFHTERPDSAAAGIMEGRVAILVDGTPFVLLVPTIFMEFFQASEDYYQRSDFATLLRILRLLCFFIALLAPSLYIAVTTFHQEMLPEALLLGLAAQREGIPFPAFLEALIMEITFEILREAGLRLPRTIGQTISIVGTLVIGQSAVEANLVSAGMVIVVSITAIANFAFPAFNMAISIRMLRFPMMGLAAAFGLYGITLGMIALILHLCSLRSFGVPYMSPFAPFARTDWEDALIRFPIWKNHYRPRYIAQQNPVRENTGAPQPSQTESGGNRP